MPSGEAPLTKKDLDISLGPLTAELHEAFKSLRDHFDQRMCQLETRLLQAFADATQACEVKFQKLSPDARTNKP